MPLVSEIAPPSPANIFARLLAAGEGWSVSEYVCSAGPDDRPFEERHDGFSISAVVSGQFSYRCESGAALMFPGALMLGNSGRCFRCGHEHGAGDRCISLSLDEDLFGEVAATAAGSAGFAFDRPSLPPAPSLLPAVAVLARAGAAMREDAALGVAETVLTVASGWRASPLAPRAGEMRRVAEAIARIECDTAATIRLADLSRRAAMSRYHFLRVFKRIAGVTPHQYVIAARLSRAAAALAQSRRPVLEVALEAGFGDLSTFNRRFRETYGMTPLGYRKSAK
jgi:AraC-like DNA-binding protein